MSVQFTIQEYFTVNNTNHDCGTVAVMHKQLEQLVAHMTQKRVGNCKLHLTADGKGYDFCGTTVTPELSALLSALTSATTVALSTSYEYNENCGVQCSCSPINNELCQLLKQQGKNLPEGVFYCVYSHADSCDGVGSLTAYGTRNGNTYYGEVPYADAELPNDGDWFTPQTAVVCEPEELADIDFVRVKTVCEELCTLSEADTLSISETEILFFLNNLQLNSKTGFEQFIRLYAQLVELTHGQCAFAGELVDLSGDTPRLMALDIQANGKYSVRIASI